MIIGKSDFGLVHERGRSRVPNPPIKIRAFRRNTSTFRESSMRPFANINDVKTCGSFPFDSGWWFVSNIVDYAGYLRDFVGYSR